MKHTSTLALMTGALLIPIAIAGCDTPDEVRVSSGSLESGSMRLALETGGVRIDTVTAVISGDNGFVTQTHEIDVSGDQGSISIFFGELPEGNYEIELSAADCYGSAEFGIDAGEIAFVNVVMSCGGVGAATGSVQITGTIQPGSLRDCDHVLKIVAAPSIQNGDGPSSSVELFLKPGVIADEIEWSITSSDGGAGGLFGVDDELDSLVNFDCSSDGTVSVIASVVAPCDDGQPCRQQARAQIECVNQGGAPEPPNPTPPACGNGVIDTATEQCDINAPLPPGTPAGSSCSASCIIVPPTTTPPPTAPGACFACAQASCPTQFAAAVGTTDAATLADISQLFACVIGPSWQGGGPIPATSCFFSDPVQPLGSLVPCYCGSTPQATCLATGPANSQEACGLEVEVSSRCNPLSASCVTSSGSNPAVPLGAALQLLNCERAACAAECGFPPPVEE
jgi:hypothetical protein